MITVQLDKNKHDRNYFDCGVEALNNYLKVMASQQSKKDNTRTFVLTDENKPERIIGYYTLRAHSKITSHFSHLKKWSFENTLDHILPFFDPSKRVVLALVLFFLWHKFLMCFANFLSFKEMFLRGNSIIPFREEFVLFDADALKISITDFLLFWIFPLK